MIREHHPAHLVRRVDIRGLLGERHLDRSGTPGDEIRQFPLSDALQRLVHLSRVHISLDDIQDRDIRTFLHTRGDQDVLGLQKSAHDI